MSDERKGGWIKTYSGGQFWPLDPRPEEINLADIAHALAHTCRYNGHTEQFYSVAQHSVEVSLAVGREGHDAETQLWGLLHDAGEAYLPDVCRPIKNAMMVMIDDIPWTFRDVENRIMRCVASKFGIEPREPDIVGEFDFRIMSDEAAWLMDGGTKGWTDFGEPLGIEIVPVRAVMARKRFLERFAQLEGMR